MAGLLLTSDLMFSSRVTTAAKQLGAEVQVSRPAVLQNTAVEGKFPLVMIDLVQIDPDKLTTLVEQLKQASPETHVVAYGPHVDQATLESAQHAGCDEVLTKSQFHQQVSDLINNWLLAK